MSRPHTISASVRTRGGLRASRAGAAASAAALAALVAIVGGSIAGSWLLAARSAEKAAPPAPPKPISTLIRSAPAADETPDAGAPGPACPLPPAHCQVGDRLGHGSGNVVGLLSDMLLNGRAADDFRVAAPGTLTQVCWNGFYFDTAALQDCLSPPPHQVRVTYFGDAGGLPGAPIGGPFFQLPNRVLTGGILNTTAGPLREWNFQLSHPPVLVNPGVCYWVEIVGMSPGPCVMGWTTSPEGDGACIASEGGPYVPGDVLDFDLAWCAGLPLDSAGGCVPTEEGPCIVADPWTPSIFDLDWACSGVSRSPVVDVRGRVRDSVGDPLPTSTAGGNSVDVATVDTRSGTTPTQSTRAPVGQTTSGPRETGPPPSPQKDCGPPSTVTTTPTLTTAPTYQSPPPAATTPSGTTVCNTFDLGLGVGWNFATSACVEDPASGAVALVARDSTVHVFQPATGGYTASSGSPFELEVAGATATARAHNGTTFTYEQMTPAIALPGTAYLLTAITDRNGNATNFTYVGGRLVQITDTEGRQVSLTHHPDGHIASMADSIGRVVSFGYTGDDLTTISLPTGQTIAYTYDADHVMTSKTIPGGGTYQVVYGPTHRGILDPDGQPIYTLDNPAGWTIDLPTSLATRELTMTAGSATLTDARGNAWQYDYDLFGQVYHITDPLLNPIGVGWNHAIRRIVSIVDRNGHNTQYAYDARGNLTQVTDALSNVWNVEYDPLYSRTTRLIEPDGDEWTYEYDLLGNLTRIVDPLIEAPTDRTVRFEYDGSGRLIRTIDRDDVETTFEYTSGLVSAEHRDPGGLNITHTHVYDAMGRLLSTSDPVGTVRTYQYDQRNRRTQVVVDPGASPHLALTTTYTYDARGRLTLETDPRGTSTSYEYDSRDRVVRTVRDPGGIAGQTLFAYDANGNLTSVTDALGGVTSYAYDALNRQISATNPEMETTSYQYDNEHNVLRETDGAGSVVAYTYDALNRAVTETIDPDGLALTSTVSYAGASCGCGTPGAGLIHRAGDYVGRVTYYEYDALDRLVRVIRKINDTADNGGDADDSITEITRDAVGRATRIRVVNAPDADEVAEFEYDAGGRQRTFTLDPSGAHLVRTSTFDAAGRPIARTEFNGNAITLGWDAAGRLLATTDAQGLMLGVTYDAGGNVLALTDANGASRGWLYDALGRTTRETDALGHPEQYEYDALSRLVRREDRLGRSTRYAYDGASRLVRITDALTHPDPTTVFAYDGAGRLLARTDAQGGQTQYVYDAADRLLRQTYPDGGELRFTYSNKVGPDQRRDPNGDEATYGYDSLGRVIQVSYAIDPMSPAAPTPTATYSYDRAGRLRSANNANATVGYQYDALGRITRLTRGGLNVDYAYALGGGTTTRTISYPSGLVVSEQRDARDRLAQIADGGGPIATYAYDTANRLLSRALSNGTTTEYTLDANRWATRIKHLAGPSAFVDLEYGRDFAGNPTFVRKHHDLANSERYVYDTLQRLVRFERGTLNAGGTAVVTPSPLAGPLQAQEWNQLDPLGNWRSMRATAGGVTDVRLAAIDAANAYTQIGGRAQGHDQNGNLLLDSVSGDADGDGDIDSDDAAVLAGCLDGPDNGLGEGCERIDAENDGDGDTRDVGDFQKRFSGSGALAPGARRYRYDAENRLVQVTIGGGPTVEYAYDALGRRISRTEGSSATQYVYDAHLRVLEERDGGGGVVARYTYGGHIDDVLTMDRGGQRRYFHRDAVGSTVALTDAAGQVVERYLYDPYGKPHVTDAAGALRPASAYGNPSLFTGRWYDAAVGLYDYRARTYDPEQGRFLSRDPLDYVDTDNLYTYVRSRPTALTDALGLKCTGETCIKVEYKLEKKKGQKRIGPITFDLSYSFTLEGSQCRKCCPEDTQRPCEIVTDYDVTAKGEASAEASASTYGGKINTYVLGEIEYWAGIKVTLRLTGGVRGSLKSDWCNNKPACGEIAAFASGSLSISGGGEVKYSSWLGEARIGADITGTGTLRIEVKFKCCLPPLKCEKIKAEVCLDLSADINISVVFWSGSFNLFKVDNLCFEF